MEEINGKRVIRIGVVGENDEQNKQFITAMAFVIEGSAKANALNFNAYPSTIHDTFKIAYKEIGLETEKYYYKFLYYPNFIAAIQHDKGLIEKSLMTGVGKPDVFISVVYGEFGRDDAQFVYYISKLRIPLSGIFIHYEKPDRGEEIDIERLEHMARGVMEEFQFYMGEPENYEFTDLKLARYDSDWARPVKNFIDELDRIVVDHIKSIEEDRRSNGPKNTKQIQTHVYLPCKHEGFDKPLEDGQHVDLEFESKKLKGAPYKLGSDGGKFEDFRKSFDREGQVQVIGFNLDKQEKIRLGDRFFIKVNGRIDGVGVVVDVTY